MFIIGFLTFAKVWQSTYEPYGIPIIAVIIGMPLLVIISSLIIGYLDFKYEIQKHENLYYSNQAGWDYQRIDRDIQEIKEALRK